MKRMPWEKKSGRKTERNAMGKTETSCDPWISTVGKPKLHAVRVLYSVN